MTSPNRYPASAVPQSPLREVVAGVVNDGSAALVAQTAVRLARELGGRVRFVQVMPDALDAQERADAEDVTFAAALRALHGSPKVQATFEAPSGDARELLVHRSRMAVALVVGQDHPGADPAVATYCQANSGCRVVLVTTDLVTTDLVTTDSATAKQRQLPGLSGVRS